MGHLVARAIPVEPDALYLTQREILHEPATVVELRQHNFEARHLPRVEYLHYVGQCRCKRVHRSTILDAGFLTVVRLLLNKSVIAVVVLVRFRQTQVVELLPHFILRSVLLQLHLF